MYGHVNVFFYHSTKPYTRRAFLFDSVNDKAVPKWGLFLEKRNLLQGENILLKYFTPTGNGDKIIIFLVTLK